MFKKVVIITVMIVCLINITNVIYAMDIQDVAKELDLNSLIYTLQEYTDDELDLDSMTQDLLTGKGTDYGKIGNYILNKLLGEIRVGIKSSIAILIVVILMAIVNGLELEKDSSLSKITSLVGFLVIVGIILKSYMLIITVFADTINLLASIMEIISPFMLAILIATGEVVTSGIIGPVLLFVTSLVGVLVSYVILPLLTLSIVLKIISNMSEGVKIDKLSNLFSSSAMWMIAVVFTLFLGVLELEGNVTTSVDEVTVKTAQTAVSNLVPVVGKFVSDSLEVVMGASELIGKTVGVIGIIVIVLASLIPIIKLVIYSLLFFVLSALAELLNTDGKIVNLCSMMSKQYKTMVGIMVGVMITFIIGIGIVINLMGKVGA